MTVYSREWEPQCTGPSCETACAVWGLLVIQHAVMKGMHGGREISHKGPCLDFILETMGALDGVTHSYLHFRKKIASTEVRKLYLP